MPAPWTRLSGALIPPAQVFQRGGVLVMATAAKKHVTVFTRSRRARGAGRLEVKNAFREAAAKTGGIWDRGQRNLRIKEEMLGRNLRTGIRHVKSRSKYAPLAGSIYEVPMGMSVTQALKSGKGRIIGPGAAIGPGTMPATL